MKMESLEIGLASPETIRQWGRKVLPNGKIFGEVTSSQTVNYKTQKPIKKGLFCERIFGPIEDYVCSCGKKGEQNQKFCNDCDVEYTSSKVRRYRLGYIELGSPVAHLWFVKGRLNYISTLLGIRRRRVDSFLYGTRMTHSVESLNFLGTIVNTFSQKKFLFSDYNFFFILPLTFPFSWHSEEHAKSFIDFFSTSPESSDFPILEYFPYMLKKNFLGSKYETISNQIIQKKKSTCSPIRKFLATKKKGSSDFSFNGQKDDFIFSSFEGITKKSRKTKQGSFSKIVPNEISIFKTKKNKKNFSSKHFDDLIGKGRFLSKKSQVEQGSNNIKKNINYHFDLDKKFFDSTNSNKGDSVIDDETKKRITLETIRSKQEFRYHNLLTKRKQKSKNEAFTQTLAYTKEQSVRDQLPCLGAHPFREVMVNLDFFMLDFILSKKLEKLNRELAIWLNKHLPIPLDGEIESYTKLKGRRLVLLQRIKLVKNFIRTKQKPEWIILLTLPVLPPGLRPILQLSVDQPPVISDLNTLYQKLLNRNKRFSQKSFDNLLYKQRLLQESVDALIENGKGGSDPVCASNGRPLKSLSDMLKGKKGRFRRNLLGKRVDYSGRSVIVVGPQLQIHECGLPKEMAVELFYPFLIRQLSRDHSISHIGAKKIIARKESIIWEALEQILEDHLILLNRAPTLHRLGIQAFQPKLINGKAILLHPLVCTGFNADFDGDQMAVHIPLSYQARAEAWQLMWSRNNILSPATGQPVLSPSQDMVLGCYYLTTENHRKQRVFSKQNVGSVFFSHFKEAILAYAKNFLDIHSCFWIRYENDNDIETGNRNNTPIEIRIDSFGNSLEFYENIQYFLDVNGNILSQQIRTTVGRIIFNEVIQDCL